MGYGKRIETLCSLLTAAKSFADVGCDHGYCTEYMLKSGLCEKAVFLGHQQGQPQKGGNPARPVHSGRQGAGGARGRPLRRSRYGGRSVDRGHGRQGNRRYPFRRNGTVFCPRLSCFSPCTTRKSCGAISFPRGRISNGISPSADGKFYDVICGRRLRAGEAAQRYTDAQFRLRHGKISQSARRRFWRRTEKQLKELDAYLSESGLQEASRRALEERKARLEGGVER